MNRISITGLGLLVAMAVGTSSVMADGSLLTPALLGPVSYTHLTLPTKA